MKTLNNFEIKIPRYQDHTVDVHNKSDDSLFCTLNNIYEFNKFRLLLMEQKLTKYCYFMFDGEKIYIDRFGTLSVYPDGFYDEYGKDVANIVVLAGKIRDEESKK